MLYTLIPSGPAETLMSGIVSMIHSHILYSCYAFCHYVTPHSLLQAHTLGLVDDIGLQRVVTSALADLRWARARYAYQIGVDWDRVVRQLNKDIKAANDFLPDDKQVWIQPIAFCFCGNNSMLHAKQYIRACCPSTWQTFSVPY